MLFGFEAAVSHLSGQCDADAAALVAPINVKARQLFLEESGQSGFTPSFHENWNRNSAGGSASSSLLSHIFCLSVRRLMKRFGLVAGEGLLGGV